jgi:CubicO group peptidase (beta-lactamase class C family)
MRRLLPLLLVSAGGAALAAQTPQAALRIQRIEHGLVPPVIVTGRPIATRKLEDRMRELKVPGVSAAVFHDGHIDWTSAWGYADVAAKRKVESDTLFQAASISKPVAAVVALSLVSRDRLSLDTDVNTYLKSWKVPENQFTATEKVTLRRLLTHSAGTTVHGFRGYAQTEDVPTLLQVLGGLKPANSAPIVVDIAVGSRWRYSGGGLTIVQQLIEDVTGKPFAQAARELVLDPFDMDDSTFLQPLPGKLRENAATGYRANGSPVEGRFHTYPEQAAAGLWTTPRDLAKFAMELQKIANGKSTKVLSATLARDMLQRQFEGSGLGVVIEGQGAATRFTHGGANEGFRATFAAYRLLGSGVVVMTNSDNGGQLATELVRAIAREYRWPGLGPIERALGKADPASYKDFVGKYEVGVRSPPIVLRIEVEGERLFAALGQLRTELLPEAGDIFFSADADVRMQFVRDASRAVTEIRVWQGGVERKATRVN